MPETASRHDDHAAVVAKPRGAEMATKEGNMPFQKPTYPEILTNTHWQSHKGAIAKVAGETGIGALLGKSQAAYNAVGWGKFELHKVAKQSDLESIETAYNQARSQGQKLKELFDRLKDIEEAAGRLADAWKRDSTIPAASANHAQAVSAAAKRFSYETSQGTISEKLDSARKEMMAPLFDAFKLAIQNFQRDVGTVRTLQDYTGFWGKRVRNPAFPQVAKVRPQFQSDWDVWKRYSNTGTVMPTTSAELTQTLQTLTQTAQSVQRKFNLLV